MSLAFARRTHLRKAWTGLLMGLCLVGCTPGDPSGYHRSDPQRVIGHGKSSVTIANVRNEADARPLAEEYCGKYGKAVQFNRLPMVHLRRHKRCFV